MDLACSSRSHNLGLVTLYKVRLGQDEIRMRLDAIERRLPNSDPSSLIQKV